MVTEVGREVANSDFTSFGYRLCDLPIAHQFQKLESDFPIFVQRCKVFLFQLIDSLPLETAN